MRRSSRNSSLPPSQDPPSAPPRPRKPSLGAQAGGQPGHEGTSRRLLPLERVDVMVDHWPERCRLRAPLRRGRADRRGARAAPPGLRAAADRRHGHRAPPAPAPLPGLRRRDARRPTAAGAFGPRLQAAVATLAVRNRVSRRDTVELDARAVRRRALDRLGRRDRRAAPGRRSQSPTRTCSATSATPRRSTSTRPAGTRGGKRTLWGALTPSDGASSGSPPTATSARPRRSSARTSKASSAPIAGGPTTTSTPSGASSAGRTWSATSPPTPKGSPRRRSSARPASRSPGVCSRPGTTSGRRRPRPPERAHRPAQARAEDAARTVGAQEHQDEAPPPLRQEPAQALAGAMDLYPPRRRRADQQPRRARPTRGSHLPQALARQPVRAGRAHDRAAALGLGHLPPAGTLALRLPHRRPQRQHPRRPHPRARLTSRAT